MKLTKCPFCKTEYPSDFKECPNCRYKTPFTSKETMIRCIGIILGISIWMIVQLFIYGNQQEKIKRAESIKEPLNSETLQEIKIRPLSDLSKLTKDDILKKRKEYIKDSIVFSNIEDYTLNPNVYQIEDKTPWISISQIVKYGASGNPNIAKGESRHSISVNNPELLVTFIAPQYSNPDPNRSEDYYLLPKKLTYDSKNNILRAHFDFKEFFKEEKDFKVFTDETNARDLGYEWVFASDMKNISFENYDDNISVMPYRMLGYYHKGYSCGLKSGCNNYSPRQVFMEFYVTNPDAYIVLDFWKEKPRNSSQKPDITYIMIFE